MEQGKGKPQAKTSGGYVWDPEKLAWVQVKESPRGEAPAEPVKTEQVEEAALDETAVEDAAVEELEAGGIEYKGAWIRVGAAIIDVIVLTILGLVVRFTVGYVFHYGTYIVLILGLLYFAGFWWWRGQTPGLMLIRARVVKTNGDRIGFVRAFVRYIFYLMPAYGPILYLISTSSNGLLTAAISWLLAFLAIVPMGLSRQKRGIHDLVAGTCVIDSRVPILQAEAEEVEDSEAAESESEANETNISGRS